MEIKILLIWSNNKSINLMKKRRNLICVVEKLKLSKYYIDLEVDLYISLMNSNLSI